MANLQRKEVKQQAKGTSRKVPSKRSPRKSMPLPPVPSEPVKPQANSTYHNLVKWLKGLFGTGK